MNCNDVKIKELLALYHDDILTEEEKNLVDEHLAACPDCAQELKLFAEMQAAFELDEIDLPDGFHEAMMKRVHDEAGTTESTDADEKQTDQVEIIRKVSFYKRYSKYMNVAAMLVFVILLSVIGLTNGNEWLESSYDEVSDTSQSMEKADSKSFEAKEEAKEERAEAEMDMAEEAEVDASEPVMEMAEEIDEVTEEKASEEVSVKMSEESVSSNDRDYAVADEQADDTDSGGQEELTMAPTEDAASEDVQTGYTLVEEDDKATEEDSVVVEEGTKVATTSESEAVDGAVNDLNLSGNGRENPGLPFYIWALVITCGVGVTTLAVYLFRKK